MTVSERQLDQWWDTLGKHSLLDYLNQGNSDVTLKNGIADSGPSQFDLGSINWLDKARKPAKPQAQWSWAYVFDQEGEIHPECEALYNEVCRYGEVHTEGFIIALGGRDNQLLNKRIPKKED